MVADRPGSYPLHLELAGKAVLVAGGGPVAARRVAGCLAAGAEVTVVAPSICEDLSDVLRSAPSSVRWEQREARAADLTGVWLVHTATGDQAVDDELARAAHAQRIWCVTAGDVDQGSARTPAVLRRDDIVVGVSSTASPDPARATALRNAVALALDTGALPLRRRRPGIGRVVLVGGGPGDAGLITVRGRRAMAEADVVVHDRLSPRALLEELAEDVVLIDVGKTVGHHAVPQHEINALLVEHALAGSVVVRLKGGDPFLFGRGSEEVDACRDAGVEVEVIAGVSSALAVPLAAGIPVTSRGLARGVLIMTGHELAASAVGAPDQESVASAARWCARGNTIVVLMGVATLAAFSAGLIEGGLGPATPTAVISSGTTSDQRTVRGPIGRIAELATAAGISPPAVIVVGAVAALGTAAPAAGD